MKRRKLLCTTGVGITTIVAGCGASETLDDESDDGTEITDAHSDDSSDDDTEEETDEQEPEDGDEDIEDQIQDHGDHDGEFDEMNPSAEEWTRGLVDYSEDPFWAETVHSAIEDPAGNRSFTHEATHVERGITPTFGSVNVIDATTQDGKEILSTAVGVSRDRWESEIEPTLESAREQGELTDFVVLVGIEFVPVDEGEDGSAMGHLVVHPDDGDWAVVAAATEDEMRERWSEII